MFLRLEVVLVVVVELLENCKVVEVADTVVTEPGIVAVETFLMMMKMMMIGEMNSRCDLC